MQRRQHGKIIRMRSQLVVAITITAALLGCAGFAASEAPKKSASDSTWIRASSKHTEFIAFTENGQSIMPFAQQSGRASVSGVAGTVISIDNSQPTLHNGCIKIDCEKGNVTFGARLFAVTVPAGATAFVQSFPATHVFRVAALSAPDKEVITVRFKQARVPVRLAAGEAVSTHGTDHPATPSKFDAKEVLKDTPDAEPLLKTSDVASTPCKLTALRGTEFKCKSSGIIAVRDGEALIQCNSGVSVAGPIAVAVAKKGALVDVEAYSGDFRVKALSGPGHVAVQAGDQTLPVHPGQELFVANRVIEDSDLTPPDGVGRRRFDRLTLTNGGKAVMSDFSILSFLGAAEHMQAMRHSSDADDHAVAERILKTAAVVHSLTTASGPYKLAPRTARKKGPVKNGAPSA